MVASETIKTESENWNVAKSFAQFHILLPLIECRKLIHISLFGCEDINNQMHIPPQLIISNRINALQRLHEELKQLIADTKFVMDTNIYNEKIHPLKKDLFLVGKYIGGISYTTEDTRTKEKEIHINEEHFNNCLTVLRKVDSDLKEPLNEKSLIFPSRDDLDLDALKRDIIEGG